MSSFDLLCNDTLAHVLSYADFSSAVRFSHCASKSLRRRIENGKAGEKYDVASFEQQWRGMYLRHRFSPVDLDGSTEVDYVEECRKRRRLFFNLMCHAKNRGARTQSCFNLPHRYFTFIPITPTEDDMELDDPPPVDFYCQSFMLTSASVGSEFVLLNPFDGSLSVFRNCRENAVKSDDVTMDLAMLDTDSAITPWRERINIESPMGDDHVDGNHHVEHHSPPFQVLLDKWRQDYIDPDFLNNLIRQILRRDQSQNMVLEENNDVQIVTDYIGIEAKSIMETNGVKGTQIVLARSFSNYDETTDDNDIICTEIMAWNRMACDETHCSLYREQLVCRLAWIFHCMDTCARYNRAYVSFPPNHGPQSRQNTDATASPFSRAVQKTVYVYSLLPFDKAKRSGTDSQVYCSEPQFSFTCHSPVTIIVVDPTGSNILVGTAEGTIEVWQVSDKHHARCRSILDLRQNVLSSAEAASSRKSLHVIETEHSDVSARASSRFHENNDQGTSHLVGLDSSSSTDESTMEIDDQDQASHSSTQHRLPRINPSRLVESIHVPFHCPVGDCGFVSVQHDASEGTTLLLWKMTPGCLQNDDFQVVSLINLPLLPQPEPQIHYDGRRLIVLGRDHIGTIILVYHVLSSWEDLDYFTLNCDKKLRIHRGDESAGLYNFTDPPRVTFANRIRHAGLGGFATFDSVYMSCNERFIIVNTKTGNLVGGDIGADEGLLVIDLEEH